MFVGPYVFSDLQTSTLKIPTATTWGHEVFQERLQTPTADLHELQKRQLPLLALTHPKGRDTLQTLQTLLATVKPLDSPPTDSRVRDGIEQIYWSPQSLLAPLNLKAFVISALVIWKTLILPGLTVIVPILSVILPFLILKFIRGVEVSATQYLRTLREAVLRQVNVPHILRAKHAGDHLGHLLETGFLCVTLATFASSIWNQIQTARHQRRIVGECETQGLRFINLVEMVRDAQAAIVAMPSRLQQALSHFQTTGKALLALTWDSAHAAYGALWNDPTHIGAFKQWVGELDVYVALATLLKDGAICLPAQAATPTTTPHLEITGLYHPALATPTHNDAHWLTAKHVLLTGPNRGGKSTFCKSVGLAVLCAQTWGFAWASAMTYTPFAALETALSPADVLGRLSLFESEIEFAKGVLARADKDKGEENGPMFVMMDEIFHSTNAHDGVEASRIFLKKLYDKQNVLSLISTHYRELPESFEESAAGWYMECLEDVQDSATTKKLTYTYKVKTGGVSEHSSVFEILQERGLI